MTIYGIDLGTTYSCIARIDGDGRPAIIENTIGKQTTPSVVYFETPHHVVVGEEAKRAALVEPKSVAHRIKRDMGKADVEFDYHGKAFRPEAISALILRDLVESVRAASGEQVEKVVITVPAYFGVAERESTRAAGRMAGLDVVNVVAEPVAAAFYYGVQNSGATRTVLVFDLGGGTFDTTVIRLGPDEVTVICTDGDHELGGADWDDRLAEHLCDLFTEQFPRSGAGDDEEFLQQLALDAEVLKQSLSKRQAVQQRMIYGEHSTTVEVTRNAFDAITAHLVERTMVITERTLAAARVRGVDHYDDVLLVGGSTRMPMIATALRERFRFMPKMHEPDLAVAKGAAWFALHESARLGGFGDGAESAAGVAKDLDMAEGIMRAAAAKVVTNVVPRAFGVAVIDPEDPEGDSFLVAHLIRANTPLPAQERQLFHTAYDDQTSIEVNIYEQAGSVESIEAQHNNPIGQAVVRRLPPRRKGTPVDITFRLDGDNVLHVDVVEIGTKSAVAVDINISGLTDREVEQARAAVAKLM
jgi:molecular chaperone DnaK (HSP70)